MPEPWFPDRAASRAVLIGASTFHSPDLPDLPAVAHNLDALEKEFTDPSYGVIGECAVLADQEMSDAKVGIALSEAAEQATDLLLVYYAGHGVLDDDGRLHLARPDTSLDHIGWTGLAVDLVKRDLARARARARVLVLDCCFSGRAVAAMADSRSLLVGQLDLSGTYTLTSTTATAPSHAPPDERYTSFTHAFLRSLLHPDPLTLDEIYRRIDAELEGLGLPRPQHNATNNAASLVLTRGRAPVLPPAKPAAPPEPGSTLPPESERTFDVSPPSSIRTRRLTMLGWAASIVVCGTSIALSAFGAGDTSGLAPLLITSAILVILIPIRASGPGELLLTKQDLHASKWHSREKARIPWSYIRTIRVFDLERSTDQPPRCSIEIEVFRQNDVPLEHPFSLIFQEDRPVYCFGEINADADTFKEVLHRTAGGQLST